MEQQTNLEHQSTTNPWNGTFLFSCFVFLGILLLFIGLRVLAGTAWANSLPNWVVELGFSFLSQIVIMLLVPLIAMRIYWKKKEKTTPTLPTLSRRFGFDKPKGRTIAYAFALGALIYLFNIIVAGVFTGVLSLIGFRFPTFGFGSFSGVGGLLIAMLLIGVLPGLCEEVTHRGLLLNSFAQKFGIMKAMLYSSILFGFMHLNVIQVFYAAILGYIIALAVVATRSLWVGVIMHFMNNGLGTYFSLANRYNWFGGNFITNIFNAVSTGGVIFYLLFTILLYLTVMRIIHMFAKETYQRNRYAHLAQIIAHDPEMRAKASEIGDHFELFAQYIEDGVARLPRTYQLRFYLDPNTMSKVKRHPQLTPLERTAFWGIMFLGGLVTLFTLIWGLL